MTTAIASPLTEPRRDSSPRSLSNKQLGSRLLYDVQFGVSVYWHDFSAAEVCDCPQTFAKETLVLCLNLLGRATVRGDSVLDFDVGTAGVFCTGSHEFEVVRHPGKA